MDFFNEANPYGSAEFASASQIEAAGLFTPGGLFIGFFDGRPLYYHGDASMLTTAGAGGGKLLRLLAHVVCGTPLGSTILVDPRGELSEISEHNLARTGDYGWNCDPFEVRGRRGHSCNVLDILTPTSLHFHSDCRDIGAAFQPLVAKGDGAYFEQKSQSWFVGLTKSRVLRNGGTSLPDVYRCINEIESNPEAWKAQLRFMLECTAFDDVVRTATEMLIKQQDSPKEFGSVLGTLYNGISCLDDPVVRASLERSDYSMSFIADRHRRHRISIIVPVEHMAQMAAIMRIKLTVGMLYKSRSPESPRAYMIVDEAGQLGKFESLRQAFSFGRGYNLTCWALFQSRGQIEKNFGQDDLKTIRSCAGMQQFFAVRDINEADEISRTLGRQTLYVNDALQQELAARQAEAAYRRALEADDPSDEMAQHEQYRRAAQNRSRLQRPLMFPDEVMAMPGDRQIITVGGLKIFGELRSYLERRSLAGRYLANKFHPPLDKVPIQTFWGKRWREVVTEPVPPELAHLPQYQGEGAVFRYVRGFRPI